MSMKNLKGTLSLLTVWVVWLMSVVAWAQYDHQVVTGSAYCGDGEVQEEYPTCWNGQQDPGEGCDNWTGVNGVVCIAPAGWSCTYCTLDCQVETHFWPRCWDGELNAGEECDDGNMDASDGCTPQCTISSCWDGVIQLSESCDNWSENGVACTPGNGTCTYCTIDCQLRSIKGASCGDGNVDITEECDDGAENWVVCSPENGSCSYCSLLCTRKIISVPVCWDGIREMTEECDDGNKLNWDGCSTSCEVEILPTFDEIIQEVREIQPVQFGIGTITLPEVLPATWARK